MANRTLTHREVCERLGRLIDYERHPPMASATRVFHLRAFRDFLDQLGAPDRDLRIVHIAGTRGKGTVATLLAEALAHRGQRVGLFRSPHVDDLRERITVDGRWISRPAFARHGATVLRTLGRLPRRPDATFRTYFECLTAVALLHFAHRRVDWAILEAGLGGRLDATNVVTPRLTVLTALGVDHTRVLGTTLTQIAREKAGILKRGVPCLLAPQPPGLPQAAVEAVRARAGAVGAPLIDVSRRWSAEIGRHDLGSMRVRVRRRRGGEAATVTLPHASLAAGKSVATVWACLDTLGMLGDRRRGSEPFDWSLTGRFEVVRRRPPVILDGAHCPLAAAQVTATLGALTRRPLRVCLAMMEDKDHAGFVHALRLGPGDAVALPDLRNPRALPPAQLAEVVRREAPGCDVHVSETLGRALAWLHSLRPAGTLLVTGTFYHLAPARRALRRLWSFG